MSLKMQIYIGTQLSIIIPIKIISTVFSMTCHNYQKLILIITRVFYNTTEQKFPEGGEK